MAFKVLDTVVLTTDLPKHALCKGDLGAIVEVHGADSFEVEFATASGRTEAVATLSSTDLRPVADTDLVAVRSTKSASAPKSRSNR